MFIVSYKFIQDPANQRFLLINLVASTPVSAAVTIHFNVFGRSTSEDQDDGATKAMTATPRGHAASCSALPASVGRSRRT